MGLAASSLLVTALDSLERCLHRGTTIMFPTAMSRRNPLLPSS